MNKKMILAGGGVLVVVVPLVFVFLRPDGDEATDSKEVAALLERATDSEAKLEAAEARILDLESKLAEAKEPGPKEAATPKLPMDSEPDAKALAKAKKAEWKGKGKGKGKGKKWKWKGKGKQKLGLPEGMTQAEQDEQVGVIVDAHDWTASAQALRAGGQAKRGGRGMTLAERESIGSFFEVLGSLGEIGVGFYDPRVARVFVPAWVSGMGADLDARQTEALANFVEEAGRREATAAETDSEFPLRYAHQKLRDVRRTYDTEEQLNSLLRPEQLASYLAEVGDDPFNNGLGLKTSRLSCPGTTVSVLAQEITEAWLVEYDLEAQFRQQVEASAHQFATAALAVPPVATGLDAFSRRQAILRRAEQILDLQGNSEHQLLTSLQLSGDERSAVMDGHCPVFDLAVQ